MNPKSSVEIAKAKCVEINYSGIEIMKRRKNAHFHYPKILRYLPQVPIPCLYN